MEPLSASGPLWAWRPHLSFPLNCGTPEGCSQREVGHTRCPWTQAWGLSKHVTSVGTRVSVSSRGQVLRAQAVGTLTSGPGLQGWRSVEDGCPFKGARQQAWDTPGAGSGWWW